MQKASYEFFNEAQGISWMSQDPLCMGGVWGRDYHVNVTLWVTPPTSPCPRTRAEEHKDYSYVQHVTKSAL